MRREIGVSNQLLIPQSAPLLFVALLILVASKSFQHKENIT